MEKETLLLAKFSAIHAEIVATSFHTKRSFSVYYFLFWRPGGLLIESEGN
jgi:hypothetical protein